MKKINNTKVTKKARIGIAALAAIMTMSFAAPLTADAAIMKENKIGVTAHAADNSDDNKDRL